MALDRDMTLPGRDTIRAAHCKTEVDVLADLAARDPLPSDLLARAETRAADLVRKVRSDGDPGLMEAMLAEYGLSTQEGVALMCLAEALLRVPDSPTMDALIEDKIAPSEWGTHLGRSSSSLVNASTWALMLTGRILRDDDGGGIAGTLRGAVRRLGEPAISRAARQAMRVMGAQFVLGRDIDEALSRAKSQGRQGYTHSFDMLGEAAMTQADADAYFASYKSAIDRIARAAKGRGPTEDPGISIKLSALHPRFEETHREAAVAALVPRVAELAGDAANAGIGLNIDAEESGRLEMTLDVFGALLTEPALSGWDGLGFVAQAYGLRAGPVIDWLHDAAEAAGRRICVRLVKGAYWDAEIKRAQELGLDTFPVFTRKPASDVSWLRCAHRLLEARDRIYPQFATHNAHSIATVVEMAGNDRDGFEFQRLHGMGSAVHDAVMAREGTRCRIYAPVGAHRDLLAYLVRRLLENGANSSFVNQLTDESVAPEKVAADPFAAVEVAGENRAVVRPADIYAPDRRAAKGWDLEDRAALQALEAAVAETKAEPESGPRLAIEPMGGPVPIDITNPATGARVGSVREATPEEATAAFEAATVWDAPAERRAEVLVRASDLMEAQAAEIFDLLAREAGKTRADAIAELREAVDFLRYYARRGTELAGPPRGRIVCISPWNFPLAIFTGQIAGALAAGNAVLAKPAEATPLIAALAVDLLHEAGVPRGALQFLPGTGAALGAPLVSDPRVDGVLFTGSTGTAQSIGRALAAHAAPTSPLVAETGGLNAMVVDSTALHEQAVRDIITSAFQSAGQRCSACRILYVQSDVADALLDMLFGAMDLLRLGDPSDIRTDVGPVIGAEAKAGIEAHIEAARRDGRLLKQVAAPEGGHFVGPAVIEVGGIWSLEREVFGPVLHVARFKADDLERVIEDINGAGYGLTFGLHTRIDNRVQEVLQRIRVGNTYVNRNQIGAVVGSQPFGGEGLSGTGPKAGGPSYVARLADPGRRAAVEVEGPVADEAAVQAAIDAARPPEGRKAEVREMPGPTGETNRLTTLGRGTVLCLGPGREASAEQAEIVRRAGCAAVLVTPGATGADAVEGRLSAEALGRLTGFAGVACWSEDEARLRAIRVALAGREGAVLPLWAEEDLAARARLERHVCIDTTAAGGNVSLLARAGEG
nr:bifunctional proline dehydrogenase/L-glutamate gamma-semialdehyde dehydrogenase PutA [Tropicimonas sp. IMCC34011]